MNLLLKELQREARTYLIGTITENGRTLSRTMAQVVSSSKGKCFTIVPSTTPEHHLYKFKTGGLQGEYRKKQPAVSLSKSTTRIIENIVEVLFAKSAAYCAIAEDPLFRPDAPQVQADSDYCSYLVFDKELYFFNSHRYSISQIMATLKASDASYYSFFALLLLDINQQERFRSPRCSISKEDINLFSSSIQVVIQSAYDGESYLIWDRDGTFLEVAEKSLNETELIASN